jgi:GNAT superfamily N-acetyltransferase
MTAESDHVIIRQGRSSDGHAILSLWDPAIAWMVARGQPEQWGTEPASSRRRTREQVESWLGEPGLRIAEIDGEPAGASVIVAAPPPHVPATPLRETYLYFLISHREHAGNDIGGRLVRLAAADARAAGSEVLRVDCWAGAPALVSWYERQGFVRSDNFTVDVRGPWHGQVFEMRL